MRYQYQSQGFKKDFYGFNNKLKWSAQPEEPIKSLEWINQETLNITRVSAVFIIGAYFFSPKLQPLP